MSLSPIPEIVADFKAGRMVILVDEEDRENEGDIVLAAEHVTPEAINFMARHARGLVCLTLTEERCRQLGLAPMVRENRSGTGTNFTASIEAAEGVTTGISAADRARTIRVAIAPEARPADLVQPGHVFPVMAMPGGVLSLHLGSPIHLPESMARIAASLHTAFPIVQPYLQYVPLYGTLWCMAMASCDTDPAALSAAEVDARIAAHGLKDLQLYNGAMHHALLAQPNFVRELLQRPAEPIHTGGTLQEAIDPHTLPAVTVIPG